MRQDKKTERGNMNTFYDYYKVYSFNYDLAMYWWQKSYSYELAMKAGV